MNKSNTPFQDQRLYNKMSKVATRLRETLEGDGVYENPEINTVALRERLVGYIMAQRWYVEYERLSAKKHPRDDVSLLAADMALQLASDAVLTIRPKFL